MALQCTVNVHGWLAEMYSKLGTLKKSKQSFNSLNSIAIIVHCLVCIIMTKRLFRVLYALSPNSTILGPVVVKLGYSDGHTASLYTAFTYKPNPSISDIYPTDHLTR